jgi:hypothetical protein
MGWIEKMSLTTEDHDRLTRIETTLESLKSELCGNGQPGRCARESIRLAKLERWQSRMMGVLATLGILGPLAAALLARALK